MVKMGHISEGPVLSVKDRHLLSRQAYARADWLGRISEWGWVPRIIRDFGGNA